MGGRIDIVVDPFLSVLPYVKAGRMKMIATLGDKRVAGYDYPTVAETAARLSCQRPARLRGTRRARRKPVVQKIQADTEQGAAQSRDAQAHRGTGMEVVPRKPEQFDAFDRRPK